MFACAYLLFNEARESARSRKTRGTEMSAIISITALTGSDKQVSWANEIRATALKAVSPHYTIIMTKIDDAGLAGQVARAFSVWADNYLGESSAHVWIERSENRAVLDDGNLQALSGDAKAFGQWLNQQMLALRDGKNAF